MATEISICYIVGYLNEVNELKIVITSLYQSISLVLVLIVKTDWYYRPTPNLQNHQVASHLHVETVFPSNFFHV